MVVNEKSLQTHSFSNSSPYFLHAHRNLIQTVKLSQRLRLSPINSTLSQHVYFLDSHRSNIGNFSATLRCLHWCVWGVEWRSQLTEWEWAKKNRDQKTSSSTRPPFHNFDSSRKITTSACRHAHAGVTVDLWRQKLKTFGLWAFNWQEHWPTAALSPFTLRGKISGGRQRHPLLWTAPQGTFLTTHIQKFHKVLTRLS